MLEEVEYSEKEGAWLITIGFDVVKPASPLDALMISEGSPRVLRQYKKVKINGSTGDPLSVHIRKLD